MNTQKSIASIPGRLDGKTCLITGANSGLGKTMAVELAKRGAAIIMGCRRDYTEAMEEIKHQSGNPAVSLRLVDLSSLASVGQFCQALADDGIRIDILMGNAGMISSGNPFSQDGFPLMLQVNFLSYAQMLRALLANGVISKNGQDGFIPRAILTSSSRHKGPYSIDFDQFGVLPENRINNFRKIYGLSKLYLMTYAWELARRSITDGKPDLSIFAFCPGPFRSRISKNLPFPASLIMPLLPISPEKAMWPGIYLACTPELEGKTMVYYHKRLEEEIDPRVVNPDNGEKIWTKTNTLLDQIDDNPSF